MPLSILKTIDTDFSPEFKQAIDAASYIPHTDRRGNHADFGSEITASMEVSLSQNRWLASCGIRARTCLLKKESSLAVFHRKRTEFAKLDLPGKIAASRQAVETFIRDGSSELAKPVYISWGHIPYNLGSWISHDGPKASTAGYDRLLEPMGPIYMAGDHVSHNGRVAKKARLYRQHRAVSQINQMRGYKRPIHGGGAE